MSLSMAGGSAGLVLCVCLGSLLLVCSVTAGPAMVRSSQQQQPQHQQQEVLDETQLMEDHPMSLDEMQDYLQALKGLLVDMDDEDEDFLPNSLNEFSDENDMQEDTKRFDANSFLPSRGKKWNSPTSWEYGQDKRYMTPGGFIATRGKKSSNPGPKSFLGTRGRRLSAGQFHGVRGKRTWSQLRSLDGSSEQEALDTEALKEELGSLMNYFRALRDDRYTDEEGTMKTKRQPPKGFHAMRGKRDVRQ